MDLEFTVTYILNTMDLLKKRRGQAPRQTPEIRHLKEALQGGSSWKSSKDDHPRDDPYDVYDYDDPEDFYYDNEDEFEDYYEDACDFE